jgi:hypothetical protein
MLPGNANQTVVHGYISLSLPDRLAAQHSGGDNFVQTNPMAKTAESTEQGGSKSWKMQVLRPKSLKTHQTWESQFLQRF